MSGHTHPHPSESAALLLDGAHPPCLGLRSVHPGQTQRMCDAALVGEEAQELSTYCLEEKVPRSPRETLNCACGTGEPEGRSPFGALDRGGSDALVEPEVSRVDLGQPPTFLAHTPPGLPVLSPARSLLQDREQK